MSIFNISKKLEELTNKFEKLEKLTELRHEHQNLALKELKSMLILINQDQKKHSHKPNHR